MAEDAALGKGRTSIFRSSELDARTPKSEVRPTEIEGGASEIEVRSAEVGVRTTQDEGGCTTSEHRGIDETMLLKAMKEAEVKSKVTFWNPTVSTVMRYLQLTTARYSMSKDASNMLEKAVKKAYPDVYKAVVEKQKKQ